MPGLILAIDQGTTNTKALLVANDGRVVYRTSVPVTLLTPQAGYVEQDPNELWESVVQVIHPCVAYARPNAIEGVAISNQRETALAWHRISGTPVANAISWQCRRGEEVCSQLASQSDLFRTMTGLPLDPLVSASKWGWLMRTRDDLHAMAADGSLCLGTVDSWLIYKLTGGKVHVTDHTNASRTGLLDLTSLRWSHDLLRVFAIPGNAMPQLMLSSGRMGLVSSIRELAGIPIVAAIGDSHAALVGYGRYGTGTVKATYGTGSSLMMLSPGLPKPTKVLARTVAWSTAASTQYAIEGNITMTGSGVQWVGEFLNLAEPTSDAIALADSIADSAGVYFVPAMVGLGAPHWDSAARGILTGLGRNSTRAHMARAAVEAIAFQVADVFYAMQAATGVPMPALYTDGGATRNNALMQFQADILQLPVHRSACEDLSALGAAWLGGVALGWWSDIAALESLPQECTTFMPGPPADEKYRGWKHAVDQACGKGITP